MDLLLKVDFLDHISSPHQYLKQHKRQPLCFFNTALFSVVAMVVRYVTEL